MCRSTRSRPITDVVVGLPTESPPTTAGLPLAPATNPEELPIEDRRNEPLSQSDNETRRSLAELDKQLIVDPAAMSPAASGYIRSRPWASPDFLRKTRCGYMPSDGPANSSRTVKADVRCEIQRHRTGINLTRRTGSNFARSNRRRGNATWSYGCCRIDVIKP